MGPLSGEAPYSETVPDPDEGFTADDLKDLERAQRVYKVIGDRLQRLRNDRPGGYLVREAPAEDLAKLKILKGHLKEGQFVTKLRKTFTKGEMEDDLFIVEATLGDQRDVSEYTEILPTSPP